MNISVWMYFGLSISIDRGPVLGLGFYTVSRYRLRNKRIPVEISTQAVVGFTPPSSSTRTTLVREPAEKSNRHHFLCQLSSLIRPIKPIKEIIRGGCNDSVRHPAVDLSPRPGGSARKRGWPDWRMTEERGATYRITGAFAELWCRSWILIFLNHFVARSTSFPGSSECLPLNIPQFCGLSDIFHYQLIIVPKFFPNVLTLYFNSFLWSYSRFDPAIRSMVCL